MVVLFFVKINESIYLPKFEVSNPLLKKDANDISRALTILHRVLRLIFAPFS